MFRYITLLYDLFSPLCWWIDKKGEKYLKSFICMIKVFGEFYYMHVFMLCMFFLVSSIGINSVCFMFCWYWYQEWWLLVSRKHSLDFYWNIVCFLLVSRALFKELVLCMLMHFMFNIHCISYCLLLCMS